ncbi:hypothetical protein Enr10x_07590 [Gimesia panareensis]|uniref:Uncharacterized protein n=1 Tax=Gimesia panareensis TaxID=2527978 RepID=A0A517Q1F4_9PLAN|nr:hypothetical protein [Gimesia panareensis]QDT25463.1 hypothetical protein Enr10x_07590 [Gimesia panareensis]
MNSTSKEQREHSRRLMNLSSIPFVLLIAYWGLTWYWGTAQVQQDYVKLNSKGLPASARIYTDRRPADLDSNWCLIGYPHAPFPGIVSLEVDMGGSCLWWRPARQYFFWCPGYHTKVPFWAREVTGTYEDTD